MQQQIFSTADVRRHDIPKITDELLRELAEIDPFPHCRIDFCKGARRVPANDALRNAREAAGFGGAEHGVDVFDGNFFPAKREQLLEQRLAVPH